MALYNTLKLLIDLGRTEGLAEKLDIYFALNRITYEQYVELMTMLGAE